MLASKNPIHSSMGNGTCSLAYISVNILFRNNRVQFMQNNLDIDKVVGHSVSARTQPFFDLEQPLMARAKYEIN